MHVGHPAQSLSHGCPPGGSIGLPREYFEPGVPEYPCHDRTIKVTRCGRIYIGTHKINLSTVFAGQYVGVREVADEVWRVSFLEYDLGFFDRELNKMEPAGRNPFTPKVC